MNDLESENFTDPMKKPQELIVLYKKNRGHVGNLDLRAFNAGQLNLRRIKFAQANLASADFTETNLQHAEFQGTILHGAIFKNTDLTQAIFFLADLSGATFLDCQIKGAKFFNCNLNQVTFQYTDPEREPYFDQIDFSYSSFQKAHLKNLCLDGGIFENCDFSGADLSESICERVNFRNAVFSKTKMIGVVSINSYYRNALFRETELINSLFNADNFLTATFDSVYAPGVRFNCCLFDNTTFNEANLMNGTFLENSLQETLFQRSYLPYARFEKNLDLVATQFLACELFKSVFVEQPMSNINFKDTVLTDAEFQGCSLETVAFSHSNLENTLFLHCQISKCGFDRDKLSQSRFLGRFHQTVIFNSECQLTDFSETTFEQCNIFQVDMTGCNFREAKLGNSQFFVTNSLTDINLDKALLENIFIYLLSEAERKTLVKDRGYQFQWDESSIEQSKKKLPQEFIVDEEGEYQLLQDLKLFRQDNPEIAMKGGRPSLEFDLKFKDLPQYNDSPERFFYQQGTRKIELPKEGNENGAQK